MNRSMTMSGTMKIRCRGQVEQAATAAPEGQRTNLIRFDDGAAYERIMGAWSRLVGEIFLDWMAPRPGLRWIDVGCGNGAFTELVVERCAPAEVQGIDLSEGQLAFARTRPASRVAPLHHGTAMGL